MGWWIGGLRIGGLRIRIRMGLKMGLELEVSLEADVNSRFTNRPRLYTTTVLISTSKANKLLQSHPHALNSIYTFQTSPCQSPITLSTCSFPLISHSSTPLGHNTTSNHKAHSSHPYSTSPSPPESAPHSNIPPSSALHTVDTKSPN